MEGFEHVVKVAMQADKLIVASNLKFPVKMKTRKTSADEHQTHGYEVDLVGARNGKLVLASVKSFFGSEGVGKKGFAGLLPVSHPKQESLYKMFNIPELQRGIITAACDQFGYSPDQVELRLYVGKFRSQAIQDEITSFLKHPRAGLQPVTVIGLEEILDKVLEVVRSKTYINDPVVMTLKALKHAGRIAPFSEE